MEAWEANEPFMKMKENGEIYIQYAELLVEEFKKNPCLYQKENKGSKGRESRRKMLRKQMSIFQ